MIAAAQEDPEKALHRRESVNNALRFFPIHNSEYGVPKFSLREEMLRSGPVHNFLYGSAGRGLTIHGGWKGSCFRPVDGCPWSSALRDFVKSKQRFCRYHSS